jgi:hypothetical protein
MYSFVHCSVIYTRNVFTMKIEKLALAICVDTSGFRGELPVNLIVIIIIIINFKNYFINNN